MMRIDVSELVRTVGMFQTYDVDEPAYVDEDIACVKPVVGQVSITNSGLLLLVRGNVRSAVELECARCLSVVRVNVDAVIEEQYTLGDVHNSTYRDVSRQIVQDDENEVPEGLMDGMVLNLAVLVRQALILALPIAVVCKDDCKGLCPVCGIDRNKGVCECGKKSESHAFAALKEMFDNDSKDQ
jgi:uncharacterized protein